MKQSYSCEIVQPVGRINKALYGKSLLDLNGTECFPQNAARR
ncbi:hypothetical protein T4B_14985 [Trichinella pseudospiralis]|uniref:Uncharacterized protein n=1 Tax=Trichinella pseudospiralis TaxID=6337 RepID=A0A0V1GP38_TRIPS|nr:hypothetical protein T4B_14985 [Trichinella pseudospiralis]